MFFFYVPIYVENLKFLRQLNKYLFTTVSKHVQQLHLYSIIWSKCALVLERVINMHGYTKVQNFYFFALTEAAINRIIPIYFPKRKTFFQTAKKTNKPVDLFSILTLGTRII